jgi:3-methyladenine DNA glycosylase AlkC
MAALKDELGAEAGRRLARELKAAWPSFPARRFTRGLAEALEPMELLARSQELAKRLVATLPTPFAAASDVLYRALDSPNFTGWIVLPCGGFVARAGRDQPEAALPLLAAMTGRWSSEFAVRPFIERHRPLTYDHLHRWIGDADEHVRRMASEGARPRLPWASRLRFLMEDPSPNVPLLEHLVEDPSPYVRRSVANHLNDIAKDHPDLALQLGSRWIGRSPDAPALVRHGLRTLIKRGDREALDLFGASDGSVHLVSMSVDPGRVAIGDAVELTIALALPVQALAPVETIIDYRVHYIGARGSPKAPTVFKLARRTITPGEQVTLRRRHAFEHVSIRRIHPGHHRMDVQVNGSILGDVPVEVVVDATPPR